MPNTIKVPGIGPVKSTYVYVGAAVTVGILTVAYLRHRSATSTAAAATAAQDTTASTTDVTGTGYAPTGVGYSGYSPSGYDVYGNPLPTPTQVGGITVSGGQYASNNDWATAAEVALGNAGVDTGISAGALGKVLAGLAVTTDQKNLFLEAVGLLGQPPQGYPQPIHVQDPVTPAKPPAPSPTPIGAPSTPTISYIDKHGASVSWHAPSSGHATHYEVWHKQAGHATNLAGYSNSTSFRIGYFKPGTHHSVWVNAFDATGHRSPPSGTATFTTHK
jgi:hypothetical protein